MNKYITMLLLGVVVIAMALVLGVHMRQFADSPDPESAGSGSRIENSEPAGAASGEAPAETTAPDGPARPGRTDNPADPTDAVSLTGQPDGGSAPDEQAGRSEPPARPGTDTAGPTDTTGGAAAAGTNGPSSPSGTGPAGGAGTNGPDGARQSPVPGRTEGAPGDSAGSSVDRSSGPDRPAVPNSGEKTATATRGQGSMKRIDLKFRGNGMYLSFEADSPLPVKYFLLHNPERLVLDLPGAWKNLKLPKIPSNQLVRNIRLGRQSDSDRLVLDLGRRLNKHELVRLSDQKVEMVFE